MEDSVLIVRIAFYACGKSPVAMEICGLFQDRSEHVEVMRVQPVVTIRFVQLNERRQMLKDRCVPGLGEEKRLRRSTAPHEVLSRLSLLSSLYSTLKNSRVLDRRAGMRACRRY
ncbi:hypothetical protein [Pseudonocardia sp. NPDC049154]|uniref:hypothetical protein n=1 Tax=Pseudonocardia sp. NPDC049154 TaxID=3155501 RepID=UPI0033E97D68